MYQARQQNLTMCGLISSHWESSFRSLGARFSGTAEQNYSIDDAALHDFSV